MIERRQSNHRSAVSSPVGHAWQVLPLPNAQRADAGSDALLHEPDCGSVYAPGQPGV